MTISENDMKMFWNFHFDPKAWVERYPTDEEVLNAVKVLSFLLTSLPSGSMEMFSLWLAHTLSRYENVLHARELKF